jgi:hypothetical protein
VLTLRCPSCHGDFEPQGDPRGDAECPYCGRIFQTPALAGSASSADAAERRSTNEEAADLAFTDTVPRTQMSLSGQPGILKWTKNVAVRLILATCPACGRGMAKGATVCPLCGYRLKDKTPASLGLAAILRKMALASVIVIGVPAALIVFLVVVCAPRENGVTPKPRRPAAVRQAGEGGAPAKATPASDAGAPVTDANGLKARKGPLSTLRSLRDRLRGAEHGSGSAPAKTPLEKTSDGVTDPNVPPAGPGNGQQVKPDATR